MNFPNIRPLVLGAVCSLSLFACAPNAIAQTDGPDGQPDDQPDGQPGECASAPGDILDLTNWKLTLPIGAPDEVTQPELGAYAMAPWFQTSSSCDGVRFRAHTAGVTTGNSKYERSELREMVDNGASAASWSTSAGTHRMFIDQAITAVPTGKPHVVAGQIHDPGDDVIVIRLEYPRLFVDINGSHGPVLDEHYTLGKRFTVEFVARNGTVEVYYNGATTPAYTLAQDVEGCYFKAGAYTQSNCDTEAAAGAACSDDDYGEVEIFDVRVEHE